MLFRCCALMTDPLQPCYQPQHVSHRRRTRDCMQPLDRSAPEHCHDNHERPANSAILCELQKLVIQRRLLSCEGQTQLAEFVVVAMVVCLERMLSHFGRFSCSCTVGEEYISDAV